MADVKQIVPVSNVLYLGQKVLVTTVTSVFYRCTGKVYAATNEREGQVIQVKLLTCPYENDLKHKSIYGGTENFSVLP